MPDDNYVNRLRREIHSDFSSSSLSQRRQSAIRDQRVANGDLRPGQRSLNDGS